MNAKAQARKEKVLADLQETRVQILQKAAALPTQKQDEPFLGIWSVKDLLAHLTGWDFTNIEAVEAVLVGRLPAFYFHRDPDWRTYNSMLVNKYKRDSLTEMIELTRDTQYQLFDFLQAIPSESFGRDFGVRYRGYKVTIQRLLEAENKDEQIHLQQIGDFLGM
jgi:hypothetical protein